LTRVADLGTRRRPRGVLNLRAGERWFTVSIHPPAADLTELVQHYWAVRWDRLDRGPYVQHALAHPMVEMVAERDRSIIVGPTTGRFTRVIEGRGRAFGIRFRPAGFHPFLGSPMSTLTDRQIAVSAVFGTDGEELRQRLLVFEDESRMVEVADEFVGSHLSASDPMVPEINRIVDHVMADRRITSVAGVVARTGIGERKLQRLFARYIGVAPKWVIRRHRLIEAAERLAAGISVDLAAIAFELGYCDQAHFTRDFKAIVGQPPGDYARTAAPPG
jgi:AraC-like DNA-binding protein